MSYKAYVATMQSVWFSEDEGVSWNRLLTPTGGFYNEARTWAVCTHPDRPGELLAGSDQGLYRYNEEAGRFDHVPSPMEGLHILQVAQCPADPDCIVCGTRPAEIFISEDNGATWTRSNLDASTECWFINTSRVTSVHFDPKEADTIWITVEIDGGVQVRRPWPDLGYDHPRPARQRHARPGLPRPRRWKPNGPVLDRRRSAPVGRQRHHLGAACRAASQVGLLSFAQAASRKTPTPSSLRSATSRQGRLGSCWSRGTLARAGRNARCRTRQTPRSGPSGRTRRTRACSLPQRSSGRSSGALTAAGAGRKWSASWARSE